MLWLIWSRCIVYGSFVICDYRCGRCCDTTTGENSFYKFSYIFKYICTNIIILNSLFKCIKYENLDKNYYIYAYQFQCNILVYVVKK